MDIWTDFGTGMCSDMYFDICSAMKESVQLAKNCLWSPYLSSNFIPKCRRGRTPYKKRSFWGSCLPVTYGPRVSYLAMRLRLERLEATCLTSVRARAVPAVGSGGFFGRCGSWGVWAHEKWPNPLPQWRKGKWSSLVLNVVACFPFFQILAVRRFKVRTGSRDPSFQRGFRGGR